MSSLRDLQLAVLESLLSGEQDRTAWFVAPRGAAAHARFGVYENNLRANFIASLRSTFPVVRRLVGDDYFHDVARSYQRRHPSTSGDLRHVGHALAAHLAALHGGADDHAYLADVARLEWLCEDALLAAEHAPLDLLELAAVDPAAYEALCFRLHPSLRLFESTFPALRIWRANVDVSQEPGLIDLAGGADRIALMRRSGALEFLALSRGEMALLQAFDSGSNFATALARAHGVEPELDVGAALRRFVVAHAIVDFRDCTDAYEA